MKLLSLLVTTMIMWVAIVQGAYAQSGSPKCSQIENKIKKAQELVEFAKYNLPPAQAANSMFASRQKISRYQQEYHDEGCDGSAPPEQTSSTPQAAKQVAPKYSADTKEQCIKQCKQYSSHSPSQCFDICWK